SARSGIRINSIQGLLAEYLRTISSVPSVEPSLTITHFSGRHVCPITDRIVNSINCASSRAGVIRTEVVRFDVLKSQSRRVWGVAWLAVIFKPIAMGAVKAKRHSGGLRSSRSRSHIAESMRFHRPLADADPR